MLRKVFKEKKISILFLFLIILFSILQVYLLLTMVDFINYSIESYRYYFLKFNPAMYNDNPDFLKLFNDDIYNSWLNVSSTTFYNDEVKKIIEIDYFDISKNLVILSSLIISSFVTFIAINLFTCLFSNQFQIVIKDKIIEKTFEFSIDENSYFRPLKLTTTSIYDVKKVSYVIEEFLLHVIISLCLIIFSLEKMYKINIQFFYFSLTIILSFIILIAFTLRYRFKKYNKIYYNDDLYSYLLNDLRIGRKNNYMFSFSDFILRKVDSVNKDQYKHKLKNSRSYYLYTIFNLFTFYLCILIFLFFSIKNEITVINIIYYLLYQFIIFYAFSSLRRLYNFLPEYSFSRKNIKKVLDYKTINKNEGKSVSRGQAGEIIFDHVTFKYPNRKKYILDNVSFKINCSTKCALIGKSGCGKSTIIKLLNREYENYKGAIYVDGIDIKKIPLSRLRVIIGTLFENNIILNSNLEDNISLGNNSYSNENYNYAYHVSLLDNKNYFSKDNYNINYLSNGNKQQIQIARRLIKENEIFVLDSLYSSIDYKSVKEINKRLFNLQKNKTILLVTNRVELLKYFNQIIYLDDGKITFDGNYNSFIQIFEDYKNLIKK